MWATISYLTGSSYSGEGLSSSDAASSSSTDDFATSSDSDDEAQWFDLGAALQEANAEIIQEFCDLGLVVKDECAVEEQESPPVFHLPSLPKLKNNDVFTEELSQTIRLVSDSVQAILTHPSTLHRLANSSAHLSTELWLHPTFLQHWGALVSQIMIGPIGTGLDRLANRRLPGYLERLEAEDLPAELHAALSALGERYWKQELSTSAFERQFILLTSEVEEIQQSHLDVHRRFLTERTHKEFQLRYSEIIGIVGSAIKQVAILVQRELRDDLRWCTTLSESEPKVPAPVPTHPLGSIGLEADQLVLQIGAILKAGLSPSALAHWYQTKLSPLGTPSPELAAQLDATREEAALISSTLLKRLIHQCEGTLRTSFGRILALTASVNTDSLATRLCPVLEHHLTFYLEGKSAQPGILHPCAEFHQGTDADYRFLKERILPHIGPLLFGQSTTTEGLIELLAPELHAKMEPLLRAQNKTARTLQELSTELGDHLLLAVLSPDLLKKLDNLLKGPSLAALIIKHLEPIWKSTLSNPHEDLAWNTYSHQKIQLECYILENKLTKEAATQKQALYLLQPALQAILSNVKGLGFTGLGTTLSVTAMHLFKMAQDPTIRRSLLYHLVEQSILHLRHELKVMGDSDAVLNLFMEELHGQKIISDGCIERLVLMAQNLLTQVSQRSGQSSSLLSRLATRLASKLQGLATYVIRGSKIDIDKYTMVHALLHRIQGALQNPDHGLEAQIKRHLNVPHNTPKRTRAPLRRVHSCSELPI